MKKHIKIIYITFIFAIFFCLGLTNIKAEELETKVIDYSLWGEQHFGNLTDELPALVTYLESLGDDYYYYIYAHNNQINLYLFKNLDNYNSVITPHIYYTLRSTDIGLSMGIDKTYAYAMNFSFQTSGSDFSTKFESLKENVTNDNFTKTRNFGIGSSSIYDYFLNTGKTMVYATNIDNFYLNSTSVYSLTIDDVTYQPGAQLPTYYEYTLNSNLNLKKEFTHKYNNNTLKYIDLYFDNNDYGKTINFKLDIIDNSDYSLCDGSSDFVNGNSCVKPELIRTQMAFLEDYGNGLYKWTGGITLGDTIDYIIKSNDNGFTITGKINLDHDLNLFNYKKIRVSFNLGSAYNVTYSYSDDSTITSNNIHQYYCLL